MADTVSDMSKGGTVSGVSNPLTSGKSEPIPAPQTGGVSNQYTNNPGHQKPPPAPSAIANTVGQPSCNPIGQTLHGELVFQLGCPVAVTYPAGGVQATYQPFDSSGHTIDGKVPLTNGGTGLPRLPTSGAPTSSGGNSKK